MTNREEVACRIEAFARFVREQLTEEDCLGLWYQTASYQPIDSIDEDITLIGNVLDMYALYIDVNKGLVYWKDTEEMKPR